MSPVAILDRVTLPGDGTATWLDRMHADYAPAAKERGMRLAGVWTRPAEADAVEVCILWELPDTATFWRMRAAALGNASVDAFWEATDAISLERHRRVYEAVEAS